MFLEISKTESETYKYEKQKKNNKVYLMWNWVRLITLCFQVKKKDFYYN
jgi:hypothetical protein